MISVRNIFVVGDAFIQKAIRINKNNLDSLKNQDIMRFCRNRKCQFLCMGGKIDDSWLLQEMFSEGSESNSTNVF